MNPKRVSAVLVAAGSSTRMGFDKLSYKIGNRTVLEQSFDALAQNRYINEIVVVYGENSFHAASELSKRTDKTTILVEGGPTRGQSALNGVLAAACDYVAVHDAARPFVSDVLINTVLEKAMNTGAAAPAVAVKDTIKTATDGKVVSTPDRSTLFAMQTPQCFDRKHYIEYAQSTDVSCVTDDCMLFEKNGHAVYLTEGDYHNYKITTPEDLKMKERMYRVGHGYDVHKLAEDRKLILGGVEIPYEKGLLGHSDADVLVHAIMDALLGACAMGDIGKHFPDNDNVYKGADSIELLKRVCSLISDRGYQIQNIDSTILCQRPKLAPFIEKMRETISTAAGISMDCMSVKATTEEGLGFTGSGEGIAAHAVALVNKYE